MLKKYKNTLIITSIVTILPMLVGIVLWNKLPAEMATHFGMDNTPNGWSSKMFTVLGLPLFLLAIHWVCFFATSNDPKKQKISDKMFQIVLWTCPACSLLCMGSIYTYALGMPSNTTIMSQLFCGIIFLIVGNYLPKSRQNYTVGIKIPWTLADENNWNRTHRFGGKVFMIAGLVFILNTFFGYDWMMIVAMVAAVVAPMIYSFAIYKGWI